MVDSNSIPSNSDVSESNVNNFKSNIKVRKKLKLKDENELEIYNLRNEINELYISLEEKNDNKDNILKEYEKILTNLKRIILLSNTDTGSYYMAGLCCYEVYQHLIEHKSNNPSDIKLFEESKMELQYLKLSHDFYSCFVRLVPGNKDVIEILLHQNMTLLNEYGNLINFKDQRILQKEISRNLDSLFKYNFKNFKMSIKNFSSYLKKVGNNKYTKLKLEYAKKYNLDVETIRVLIKLVLFDVTDKCYDKLHTLDMIFNTPLISFDLSSCLYLKKLRAKYSDIFDLNESLFIHLSETDCNYNTPVNNQTRMKKISVFYESIFENYHTNKKSIIVSQQLKLLLKYLKYKIYYTVEENEQTYPTLHELLCTCIVFVFYSFQIKSNSIIIKAVNMLNSKQNKYLKNFFKREWNSLKLIALIVYEKAQYESSKRHTNRIKKRSKKIKQSPDFTIDFIKSEYDKAYLSLLLTLSNFYLKNEKYEIFLELTDLLIEKLINLSNIFIRKALFNLLRKKAIVFKRLNRNVKDQISILLNAHELFPDDNRINIQLTELYEELGDENLSKYFMNKSNKQRNNSTIISKEIEFDKSLMIEGDLEELLIKLKEMFPKLQKIYNENLSGLSQDYSIFNSYLTISRHMIRMIFRCQEAKKSIKKHLFDKKFLNIKSIDWIHLIQAHIICCTCLFDLKNLKTLTCKMEGSIIGGEKLIYDALMILEKSFEISFIRNFNGKIEGVKIILQIMKIIAKYNMILNDDEYKMNLLEVFLTQGKRLIFVTNDTSFLYLIIRFVETINFNEKYVGFKSPLQTMSSSNFARYVLRILVRKLQNDKLQNRLKILEQFLVCCSLYNIYTYTFKKLDDLFKDLENSSVIPYKLYLIFAINCFNHSRSRKLVDRDYTIKRGFDALFKSLEIKLEDYERIEQEIQNIASTNTQELEFYRLECLSTIYTIKYNIGRAYHNFCLSGIAEKYYWECRFSPNFNCRIASFINLTVIYQESKNELMLDKLYAEYFC